MASTESGAKSRCSGLSARNQPCRCRSVLPCGPKRCPPSKMPPTIARAEDGGARLPRREHVGQLRDHGAIAGPRLDPHAGVRVGEVLRRPVRAEVDTVAFGRRHGVEQQRRGLPRRGPEQVRADGHAGVGEDAQRQRFPLRVGQVELHPAEERGIAAVGRDGETRGRRVATAHAGGVARGGVGRGCLRRQWPRAQREQDRAGREASEGIHHSAGDHLQAGGNETALFAASRGEVPAAPLPVACGCSRLLRKAMLFTVRHPERSATRAWRGVEGSISPYALNRRTGSFLFAQ